MKIWTDDECLETDGKNITELYACMLFKAKHIKAKADPELFEAVAKALSQWNEEVHSVTRSTELENAAICCPHCAVATFTDEPFTVITQMGRAVNVIFNFCPVCGRDLKQKVNIYEHSK